MGILLDELKTLGNLGEHGAQPLKVNDATSLTHGSRTDERASDDDEG